jgi:hypothetical protein
MQRVDKPANLTHIKYLDRIYLAAAAAYATYSLIMQNGLCGYLMDLQLRWFGVANMKLTLLMAIIVLAPPAVLISRYSKSKLSAVGATYDAPPVDHRYQPIPLKSWLIMIVAPILIALPIYYGLIWMDRKDQQRQIYKFDLNHESALPSGDVKFVQLTGVVQQDYKYRLETKRGGSVEGIDTYTPLTGSGWTEEKPIRFFIDGGYSGCIDPQTRRFSPLLERGPAAVKIEGKLARNSLPTYVENEFKRAGLQVESPYFVMDQMCFDNGRIPSAAGRNQYYLIPLVGVILSLTVLIGGSIRLVRYRLRRAR